MKQTRLFKGLLVAILLLCSLYANAYNFSAISYGVTIYYNIVSSEDLTCEVTYESDEYDTYSVSSITIPETITNSGRTYTVVGIGDSAFRSSSTSRAKLTEVIIPTTITYIDNYAFYRSAKLTSLTIPNSVTEIGSYTFGYCTTLSEITIPSSVISMGNGAFYNCFRLEDVTLEYGEETLTMTTSSSATPFTDCSALKTLYFGRNLSYTTSSYAPFRGNKSLSTLTIGEKVTSIGQYEFYGCTNLTDVTLEYGEETLTMTTSSSATPFTDCSALKTLYFGRNLSYTTSSYAPFRGNKSLSTLTIGEKVTSIGQYAFYGCTGLKGELKIPNNVTSISNYAFYDCSSIETLTIEDGEKTLKMTTSSSATPFSDCSAIKTIYLGRNLSYSDTYAPFRGNTSLTSLVIGNNVMSIGQYEFYKCTNLRDLVLEDSEVTLTMTTSSSATPFTNCPIETLYLGRTISYDGSYSPFREKTALSSLTVGSEVTSIGQYEFYGCTNLIGELVIPNNVTEIESYAFYNCSDLNAITIGNGVTSIGDMAFYNCTSLKNVTLEDGEKKLATTTSSSATPFTSCPIETLYLGRNVSYDGSYSLFRDNTSLISLTIGDKVTSIAYSSAYPFSFYPMIPVSPFT